MTVRMQPNVVHEELIRSWGAIPVAVELSAAIQLIIRLDVDAQENPLANTVAYGVDQVHRHVTMTGHLYGARGLFAHRATWESFDPDLRRIVEQATRTAIEVQRKSAAELEKSLRASLETGGVEFVDLTAGEREAFVGASARAIALAHEGVRPELYDLARS
jgi:TRAP-type C4-dicarboxylate transport system substrate-binding protein